VERLQIERSWFREKPVAEIERSWFREKPVAEVERSWFREKPVAVDVVGGIVRFLTKPATSIA